MTDLKARAREIAENAAEEIQRRIGYSEVIESALLQFAREVLEKPPSKRMVDEGAHIESYIAAHPEDDEFTAADIYAAMSAERAKELG